MIVYLILQNVEEYGIDWQGPAAPEEGAAVDVPDTPCCLSDAQLALVQAINLENANNDTYGIDLYSRIVSEVERLIQWNRI